MRNIKWTIALSIISVFAACGTLLAEEKILFDFENGVGAWGVPEWCFEKKDYVCKTAATSKEFASHGSSSLAIAVDFPGPVWRAAVVECDECELDLSQYDGISCDFYLPQNSPHGITGKLILTVEEKGDWKWTETAQSVDLIPGKWVTLTASLKSHNKDWIRFMGKVPEGGSPNDPKVAGAYVFDPDDSFRANVRKVAVRIETDKATYRGNVYVDYIRAN